MSTEVNKYTTKIVYTVNYETNCVEAHDYRNMISENVDETTTPMGVAPRFHIRENEKDNSFELWTWGASGNNPRLVWSFETKEEAEIALFQTFERDFHNNDNAPSIYITEEKASTALKDWLANTKGELTMTTVTNIRKNSLGTISFTAQFKGMRKPQEFIVYPNPTQNKLTIQSKDRVGYILEKAVEYCKGSTFVQFNSLSKKYVDFVLNLDELKEAVQNSAAASSGNHHIVCDNSQAKNYGNF